MVAVCHGDICLAVRLWAKLGSAAIIEGGPGVVNKVREKTICQNSHLIRSAVQCSVEAPATHHCQSRVPVIFPLFLMCKYIHIYIYILQYIYTPDTFWRYYISNNENVDLLLLPEGCCTISTDGICNNIGSAVS